MYIFGTDNCMGIQFSLTIKKIIVLFQCYQLQCISVILSYHTTMKCPVHSNVLIFFKYYKDNQRIIILVKIVKIMPEKKVVAIREVYIEMTSKKGKKLTNLTTTDIVSNI